MSLEIGDKRKTRKWQSPRLRAKQKIQPERDRTNGIRTWMAWFAFYSLCKSSHCHRSLSEMAAAVEGVSGGKESDKRGDYEGGSKRGSGELEGLIAKVVEGGRKEKHDLIHVRLKDGRLLSIELVAVEPPRNFNHSAR